MIGINGTEFVIIVVVALIVIGPKRIPEYAQQLRDLVRGLKSQAQGLRDDLRKDMGDEFDEVDWAKLDPRQYDPRRIVKEALAEDDAPSAAAARASESAQQQATLVEESPIQRYAKQARLRDTSQAAPFDPDAT
ncbi:twin-arginine translocase TatA/TatE family subunit [Brevibacterium sp. 50QC2O2]|uniref:twin-arginine translocase TatA/TatE family subunit n=1 Tax=Brevibacterium TaxID=1696 RepID=UPI00211B8DDA|nr:MULTISPECIES: twin-arginine translocase TatA/TatE family subunit [unclassified Brevibacterium]MCQ9368422.1 twin-arginine translocase TatA/TatE family subunit [Brevibacterium sp. 91QC2O2]MCQ9384750.1 twin-arginine translocase TatA/TatE family subunit [Brevibacterium sp. 68QC2CO]MCQ9387513.1 twin-arginine translocase TatA/TatE family subunit [Brevibacterium sp. 50QC2O2]